MPYTRTIQLPAPHTPLFLGMARAISDDTFGDDKISAEAAEAVLAALWRLHEGPRFEARHVPGTSDTYQTVDRRTGDVLGTYEGYFGGQDARGFAATLNKQEAGRTPAEPED